jgi:hypothetical protein
MASTGLLFAYQTGTQSKLLSLVAQETGKSGVLPASKARLNRLSLSKETTNRPAASEIVPIANFCKRSILCAE